MSDDPQQNAKWLKGAFDGLAGSHVVFFGMDWSRTKSWNGAVCPRCQTPHCWRKRIPKKCRCCGTTFTYTASER